MVAAVAVVVATFFFGLVLGGGGGGGGETWVVELEHNVDPHAFAHTHGFSYVGATKVNPALHIFTGAPATTAAASHKRNVMKRDELLQTSGVRWVEAQVARKRYTRTPHTEDPLYDGQWHLHGDSATSVHSNGTTLTGSGVLIGIVDDGLQHTHPEIAPNYDGGTHSWDYNGNGGNDPTPQHHRDGHGTSAAAVAVGARWNGHCGRGVAPNARVAGIRLIAEPVTDLTESMALSHHVHDIDIYSNSWGPADTGFSLDSPGRLVSETLARFAGAGVGRHGKGSIYVWASGNGRGSGDSCAFDGYAGNPYVNAIGAVDITGSLSWYSEGCANLMAVAPSSGANHGITTADLVGSSGYTSTECTTTFGGTSSAAPLAAGIVALLLEQSHGNLTWRDVKHVIARGATQINPTHSSWHTNEAGYHHSNVYGFGLLRIPALIAALSSYTPVPTHQVQVIGPVLHTNALPIGHGSTETVVPLTAFQDTHITFIEMVIVTVAISHPHRGNLAISIESPSGVRSVLASQRSDPNPNYNGWSFSSVHHWGEAHADGVWKLVLCDAHSYPSGTLDWVRLGVFGY